MKAEELMIGDWVKAKDSAFPFKVVGISNQGVTKEHNGMPYYYKIDEIEPILLTPEILEKNGFYKVSQPKCRNPYHWEYKEYEQEEEGPLIYIYAANTVFRGMLVEIDNYVNSACSRLQCEYIHQFQHALRLCEINKEIKL